MLLARAKAARVDSFANGILEISDGHRQASVYPHSARHKNLAAAAGRVQSFQSKFGNRALDPNADGGREARKRQRHLIREKAEGKSWVNSSSGFGIASAKNRDPFRADHLADPD